MTAAARGPVVALVFSGGAMDVSPLLANPKIAAILICGQPSVQVVGAGDVLFGRTLDGRIVIELGDALAPCIVKPQEDPNALSVVMPVRLD